jgi:transcriptional regulator with XRE-family HTH domain
MLRLAIVQKERGLSDRDLSRLTGVHFTDISKFKNGRVPAYPGWRRAIAKVLGVPEEELFEEIGGDERGR